MILEAGLTALSVIKEVSRYIELYKQGRDIFDDGVTAVKEIHDLFNGGVTAAKLAELKARNDALFAENQADIDPEQD